VTEIFAAKNIQKKHSIPVVKKNIPAKHKNENKRSSLLVKKREGGGGGGHFLIFI
jgi:hypothetical protein